MKQAVTQDFYKNANIDEYWIKTGEITGTTIFT